MWFAIIIISICGNACHHYTLNAQIISANVSLGLNTLHGCGRGQRAGRVGSWRGSRGTAASLKAASDKHPCVHEIRVSTSDSCSRVVTVKQIMSVGGSSKIPLSCGGQRRQRFWGHMCRLIFLKQKNSRVFNWRCCDINTLKFNFQTYRGPLGANQFS